MIANAYRILLVDDEPAVLEALALTLKRAREFRAEVELAPNGEAALDRLASSRFDLVLADHRMPGMTGVELLARVRERHPDVVRALITGLNDVDIAVEAMDRARVHYYVQKPWDNDELRLTISEALKGGWKPRA